ncbi:hypothetical protein N4P33_32900, partial [Streptomyces sp. 15-116A]|nr:hypothetical protein [Streptomyces sp. 15-116A]
RTLASRLAGDTGVPTPDEIPPETLLARFDEEAEDWPGGAPALVTALAAADPSTTERILRALRAHHPHRAVSEAAAHEINRTRADRPKHH